jgi:TetR/AcrR family transcriptional regulator, mexCD-oprJ operon repressor
MDAAVGCLNADPTATMAEIAAAAGVGRVTMYAHFSSREELLRVVLDRTMERVETSFAAVDLGAEPWQADRLVESSWGLLTDLTGVTAAVEQVLPDEIHREHHDRPMARVRELLERGRSAGAFRDDQSTEWQSACYMAILHAAAAEVRAGRLADQDAADVVKQTVRALVRPVQEHEPLR